MKKLTPALFSAFCLGIGGLYMNAANADYADYGQAIAHSRQNIKAKNYALAEKDLKEALTLAKSAEDTGVTLIILGEVLYREKKFADSREQWNKAISLDGFNPLRKAAARLAVAQSYAAEGNVEKFVEQYAFLTAGNDLDASEKVSASTQLIDVYIRVKQFSVAREGLNLMIKSYPDQPIYLAFAHQRLGQVYVLTKDYKNALSEFSTVSNLEGVDPALKSIAEKQIKLLSPFVELEKEVQAANEPTPPDEVPSGLQIAGG